MRLLVPAAAAAALLALAGCSDPEPGSPLPSGAPAETSTTTASPAPSTTTTPTDDATAAQPSPVPTLPPEATTDDAAGAEAFVRYWFETVDYAYEALDARPLREASLEECSVCNEVVSEVGAYQERGERVSGGDFQVGEVVSPAPDGTGVNIVSVTYTQTPYQVVDASGRTVSTFEGEEASLGAVLRRDGDSWAMYGLGS